MKSLLSSVSLPIFFLEAGVPMVEEVAAEN